MMTYNMVVVNKETGEPRVSTLDIALGTELDHPSVIKLVRNYQDALEEFGQVRFEIRLNKQGSKTQYAMLNERQSSLIISFMRNSEVVVDFSVYTQTSSYNVIHLLVCY